MKVSRAIEVLKGKVVGVVNPFSMRESDDALRLGIEALQRIKVNRHNQPQRWDKPLPGETSEEA